MANAFIFVVVSLVAVAPLSAPKAFASAGAPPNPSPPSSSGPTAGASEAERKAAARALFQEGLTHADQRRWSEAADRFERARALRPSPEISYNLTTALMGLGKLVQSSEILRQIAADPQASSAVKNAAEKRLAELMPRLAQLTIELPPALLAAGATVRLDGNPLDKAALGVSLPLDPGSHVVEVRDGGAAAAPTLERREVGLKEGDRQAVSFSDLRVSAASVALAAGAPKNDGNDGANGGADRVRDMDALAAIHDDALTTTKQGSAPPKRRWWLWGLVGGAAAAGLTAALIAANSGGDALPPTNVETIVLK